MNGFILYDVALSIWLAVCVSGFLFLPSLSCLQTIQKVRLSVQNDIAIIDALELLDHDIKDVCTCSSITEDTLILTSNIRWYFHDNTLMRGNAEHQIVIVHANGHFSRKGSLIECIIEKNATHFIIVMLYVNLDYSNDHVFIFDLFYSTLVLYFVVSNKR